MDNRKNHDAFVNQTQKALLPDPLLSNILKKFEAILPLLSTSVGSEEYEGIEKDCREKVSGVVEGMYKSDRQQTLSNFNSIQNTIVLLQGHLKEAARLAETPLGETLTLNTPLLEKLFYSTRALFSDINQITQSLNIIEELIKKNYPNMTGYELGCITLPENSLLKKREIEEMIKGISEKQGKIPVLIKQGDKIYVFGNINGLIWKVTPLDASKFDQALFPVEHDKAVIRKRDEIKKESYKEIKQKNAHIYSRLGKKIETYKLILISLYNDVTNFYQGVQFYQKNIRTIQSNYRKASKSLLNTDQQVELLQKNINENEEAITQTQAFLTDAKNYLSVTMGILQTLKERLEAMPHRLPIKKDIDSLGALIEKTAQSLEILMAGLETSKLVIGGLKEEFAGHTKKLDALCASFEAHSLLMREKSGSIDFEKNLPEISQTAAKIALIGQEIERSFKSVETLKITVQANLISINQNLLLAKEIDLKMPRFLEQANSLERQLSEPAAGEQPVVAEETEAKPLHFITSSAKKSAIIEPADITSFSDHGQPQVVTEDTKSTKNITQSQAQEVLGFLKNQIKSHPWEIYVGGKKGALVDSVSRKKGAKEPAINAINLTITKHGSEMLDVLNAVEMSKASKSNASQDYTSAVNQFNEITQRALKKHSFFRAESTKMAYRRMKQDIHAAKRLSKLKEADLSALADLTNQLADLVNHAEHSINLVEFDTKYRDIYAREDPVCDKLIQLYLATKDCLYNKSLTPAEKKHLHHISLMLQQVDPAATLNNIKNEIAHKCRTNQWSLYLGGETILINQVKYKVPAHVKKIWDAIEPASSGDDSDNELFSFHQSVDNTLLMACLSEVMLIAESAALNPHITRHQRTQDFYMDIVTTKTFTQFSSSIQARSSCPSIN